MNDLLEPPAERDMPPGRAARMRTELTTLVHRGDPRRNVRRRLAVAVAVGVTAVVAGVTASSVLRPDDGATEVLAMSESELSPSLRIAAEQCLTWQKTTFTDVPVKVVMADIAVAAGRGHHAVVQFVTPAGFVSCEVTKKPWQEVSGGLNGDRWMSPGWMPGPLERLLLLSTDPDGGTIMATGRVSDRVRRLVLDHGDGHTTVARISDGAFGVISEGAFDIAGGKLIGYDAQGREIYRRPLLRPPGEVPMSPTNRHPQPCFVDPAGTVVIGDPGPGCRPAERWTH